MNPRIFAILYRREKYELPCDEAAKFLRVLDGSFHAEKFPIHKVDYEIKEGDKSYKSPISETPKVKYRKKKRV